MTEGRLGRDYFEKIYSNADDPWHFESAWYERRKQALTMALLPNQHYARVFEPGCASGELTRLLAARASQVDAMELVPRIAARAAQRLAGLKNVSVRIGAIPDDWPADQFDLVLLSEVAYFVDAASLKDVAGKVRQTLLRGGHVVAVHYLGKTDFPLTGRRVHEFLSELLPEFTKFATYDERDFTALVLRR